jgi:hypothetical protein
MSENKSLRSEALIFWLQITVSNTASLTKYEFETGMLTLFGKGLRILRLIVLVDV